MSPSLQLPQTGSALKPPARAVDQPTHKQSQQTSASGLAHQKKDDPTYINPSAYVKSSPRLSGPSQSSAPCLNRTSKIPQLKKYSNKNSTRPIDISHSTHSLTHSLIYLIIRSNSYSYYTAKSVIPPSYPLKTPSDAPGTRAWSPCKVGRTETFDSLNVRE